MIDLRIALHKVHLSKRETTYDEITHLHSVEYNGEPYCVPIVIKPIYPTRKVVLRVYQPTMFYVNLMYYSLDIVPEYIQHANNIYYIPYFMDMDKATYFFGIKFKDKDEDMKDGGFQFDSLVLCMSIMSTMLSWMIAYFIIIIQKTYFGLSDTAAMVWLIIFVSIIMTGLWYKVLSDDLSD